MSQLTQMRQHIKAIQTIKKITHAMRLISMSIHARIKQLETPFNVYQQAIHELFMDIKPQNSFISTDIQESQARPLIILVGSQKGLCGSFNTLLFQQFTKKIALEPHCKVITIGKRATNYVQKNSLGDIIAFYNIFGLHNILTIAHNLLQEIIQTKHTYSSVIIYSNTAPSFFIQKPTIKQIIPTSADQTEIASPIAYEWEQSRQEIVSFLTHQYVLAQIQHALLQSLLAEHAARFISMDSATRNADNLLEQLQRNYNKLRQAKITKELTELSSFFLP